MSSELIYICSSGVRPIRRVTRALLRSRARPSTVRLYHAEKAEQQEYLLSMIQAVYYVVVVLVMLVMRAYITAYRQRQKMPPGPTGLPLIGNLLQVPSRLAFLRFTEWSKQYGTSQSLRQTFMPGNLLVFT